MIKASVPHIQAYYLEQAICIQHRQRIIMLLKRFSFALVIGMVWVVYPVAAQSDQEMAGSASDTLTTREQVRLPILAGHQFIPSNAIPDPFITTHFRSTTGLGQAIDLEAPFLDPNGEVVTTLKGDMVFISLNFEYQQRINPKLAMYAGLVVNTRLGADEEILLAEGLAAVREFQVGVMTQLMRTERWLLSGTVEGSLVRSTGVSLKKLADDIIEGSIEVEDVEELIALIKAAKLVKKQETGQASIGVRGAYSPTEWLGFTVRMATGYANPFDEKSTFEWFFRLGGTIGVDLQEISTIPIGLSLIVDYNSFLERGNDLADNSREYGFGIAYTGRREFSIGIEAITGRLSLSDLDLNIDSVQYLFRMRYYF